MDSLELNKIAGALLATCLGVLAVNIAAGAIFAPGKLDRPAYIIAVPERRVGPGDTSKSVLTETLPVLLAKSDPKRGETVAKQCSACHTFDKGAANKVGPNLFGIVGRPKGAASGFNYSAALKAKGGEWTFDDLDRFIANPKAVLPGTTMAYAGLTRAGQRADLINYLRTLSETPVPLPEVAETPPPDVRKNF